MARTSARTGYRVKKLLVLPLIILIATLVAGAFGAVHDQISYTVSEEYFTKFKFIQFQLVDSPMPDRMKAAVIGFLASWWMGIPIGLFVGAAGLVQRGWRRMLRVSLCALAVVLVVTLACSVGGLAYGLLKTRDINLAEYRGWFIPENVVSLRRFLCAGYMHNASYLGGALGMIAAIAFQVLARMRASKPEPVAGISERPETADRSHA